jgi:hypothetical protein
MKRFHVHVSVGDLNRSIAFYSAMFGEEPAVVKPDYAKWMLENPRVNFAISQRNQPLGINHLGVQAETDEELEAIHTQLQQADGTVVAEKGVACCYAKSDKYWVTDPQGVAWESFRSLGSVPLYGAENHVAAGTCGSSGPAGCCVPAADAAPTVKEAGCCQTGD